MKNDHYFGDLHDYRTGEYLRPAKQSEFARSIEAAATDGGRGVFMLEDGRRVYVEGRDQ